MNITHRHNYLVVVILVGAMVWTGGCTDDPKPDLCKGKTPASARFTIGEQINNYSSGYLPDIDTVIVSDTVLNEQRIVFEAKDENDSYEWKIGDDSKVLTGKKISLWFSAASGNFDLPYTISVRLIARKKPNLNCFPKDDGIDTVIRKLTIIDRSQNPIIGNYEGYLRSDVKNSFTVSINYVQQVKTPDGDIFSPNPQFIVTNLTKGCNSPYWWSGACRMAFGFRSINIGNDYVGSFDGCKKVAGWIFVDKSGNVRIPHYILADDLNARNHIKDVFTGKKK